MHLTGSGAFNKREKTIMLAGATGSGKSTMLDAMMNYITGVSWENDFRFSIVDLPDKEKRTHLKTQVIFISL